MSATNIKESKKFDLYQIKKQELWDEGLIPSLCKRPGVPRVRQH